MYNYNLSLYCKILCIRLRILGINIFNLERIKRIKRIMANPALSQPFKDIGCIDFLKDFYFSILNALVRSEV